MTILHLAGTACSKTSVSSVTVGGVKRTFEFVFPKSGAAVLKVSALGLSQKKAAGTHADGSTLR